MSKSSIISVKIKKCLSLIEDRIGFGDVSQWTHRDYESLSSEIEAKTGVLLSVSTLKRIWKSTDEVYPQKATLDALAKFNEFKNWAHFVSSTSKSNQKPWGIKKILFVISVSILAILSIVYFSNSYGWKSNEFDYSKNSKLEKVPELKLVQEEADSTKLRRISKDSIEDE